MENSYFTAEELFDLLCRYTQCRWEKKHIPKAMYLYIGEKIYVFEPNKPYYIKEENYG